MGMFDMIHCEYPLPGNPPDGIQRAIFQTKDLGSQMDTYVIKADGTLTDPKGELVEITDTVQMYTSNWSVCAYGHTFTSKGQDYVSAEYQVSLVRGLLVSIEEIRSERNIALGSDLYHSYTRTLDAEIEAEDLSHLRGQDLLGKQMFVKSGGFAEGYAVTVVYAGRDQWCVLTTDGELELIHRFSLGTTFFCSDDEANKNVTDKEYKDQRAKEYFDKALSDKKQNLESRSRA